MLSSMTLLTPCCLGAAEHRAEVLLCGGGDGDRDRLRKVGQFWELSFAPGRCFKDGWTS
jgi:hypothetical protein